MTKTERVIMGIDPGTNVMGYGILKGVGQKAEMIAMGVIDMRKEDDPYLRLGHIYQRVTGIIDEYLPDEIAIEAPFFGKNVQSMLKLGRAQGVAIAAAIRHSVPVHEYAPMKIKMAITGRGSASKEQVAMMVEKTLAIDIDPSHLDATDALAIAMSELASISERRTYQLIHGLRGLPKYLVANPGLNSGFMIPQYTAASIVSQNKGLCWPASCDSIPSSQGQEDHVSMGSNSATKLVRIVDNVETVLGIELMNAVQAMDFRRPLRTSPRLEKIIEDYRKVVPFIDTDTYMHPLIEKSVEFLKNESYL